MTMGQRIRQARQEAGLSQRQLAGEEMTRNMLSALEHDGANPSVATLRYLSEKLCKPISWFFGEEGPSLRLTQPVEARQAYAAGEYRTCLKLLREGEREDWERSLLLRLSLLALAEQALSEKRMPYARQLLEEYAAVAEAPVYFARELEDRYLLLMARAAASPSEQAALAARISPMDEVLELRARAALTDGDLSRAEHLLQAMRERGGPQWSALMGQVYFGRKDYAAAAKHYHRAEELGEPVRSRLEVCYRELEDYKMAYYYATKKS